MVLHCPDNIKDGVCLIETVDETKSKWEGIMIGARSPLFRPAAKLIKMNMRNLGKAGKKIEPKQEHSPNGEGKKTVKYDYECHTFKYYNEKNEHELVKHLTYDTAAAIISELLISSEFSCDSTISDALYIAMRKLEGFSDKDIQRLMRC